MCNLDQGFILCSCQGEDLQPEQIGWTLERHHPDRPIKLLMGMAPMVRFWGKEPQIRLFILQMLNQSNCFDFDYMPQENDFLEIRSQPGGRTWYAYRFRSGAWQLDDSTPFDGWRTQLAPLYRGKYSKDPNSLELPENIESYTPPISEVQKNLLQELKQRMAAAEQDAQRGTIAELEELKNLGIITQKEFEDKRDELQNKQ